MGISKINMESVKDYETTYTLKVTKNRDVFNVKYTGVLVEGKFEGRGEMRHVFNDEVFYQGRFRNGDMYGKAINLYYKENLSILCFHGQQPQYLSKADGEAVLCHYNGNTAFKGTMKNGLLSGKGVEYHPNGKVRYEGVFKEGGYNGKGLKIYHSFPIQDSTPNVLLEGDFDCGKLVGDVGNVYMRDNTKEGHIYCALENAFYHGKHKFLSNKHR